MRCSSTAAPWHSSVTQPELTSRWLHGAHFFHKGHYSSALATFRSMLVYPGIPVPQCTRLNINIGLILLILHGPYAASRFFHHAVKLCYFENNPSRSGSAFNLAILFVFLIGIAVWDLGAVYKAQCRFDVCVEMFEESLSSKDRSRCSGLAFNFTGDCLDFTLSDIQVPWNLKEYEKRLQLMRRIPMAQGSGLPLHRVPKGALLNPSELVQDDEMFPATTVQGNGNPNIAQDAEVFEAVEKIWVEGV